MYCCTACFESIYIKGWFSSYKKGNCNSCKNKEGNIFETNNLSYLFFNILDLYVIDIAKGKPLKDQIIIDFNKKIFTQDLIDSGNIKSLIADIIKEDDNYKNILNNPVLLKLDVKEDATQSLFHSWDKFSKEIKTQNRFHFINTFDLVKLKNLFKYFEKKYTKGKKFYRARISNNKEGYNCEEMGNPPPDLAKNGRANPNGISYLYISDDIKTTLYEVRASLFDKVLWVNLN